MKKIQWHRADEFTKDCFNKWGYNPYHAVLTATAKTPTGVRYDATILKHENGEYILCQGSMQTSRVKQLHVAKTFLNNWLYEKTA